MYKLEKIKLNKKFRRASQPTAKAGFTLIETLVATFVLVTAIVGPLSIVAKGVFFSNVAKDQITSSYLAQEAIEYLRNKRDNNTIAGGTWANYKTSVINICMDSFNINGCKIDVSTDTVEDCGSGCPYLNRNSVSGLYGYTSGGNWAVTPYKRLIKVYNEPPSDPNSNEVRIEVTLTWMNGILMKTFVLRENLLNWQ